MRRQPWRQAVTLFVFTLITTTAADAAQPGKGPEHRSENRVQQQLGLTDHQVQAIRQIHERDAEGSRQLWQTLRQAQAALRRLILADADEGSIQAKQAEVQALLGETVQRRVNRLKEVAPILTPEQREKYAQLLGQSGRPRHHPRQRT